MRRSACLVGVFVLVLSLCAAACTGDTGIDRGDRQRHVRGGAARRDGRSAECRSRRRVDDGLGCERDLSVSALPPGVYQVTSTLNGFQTSRVENIQLQLGQILKVDFGMAVAALSESVQVSAESPIIDVKQNASTLSIQSDLIDLIPKGRDFTQVVNSAPARSRRAGAAAS